MDSTTEIKIVRSANDGKPNTEALPPRIEIVDLCNDDDDKVKLQPKVECIYKVFGCTEKPKDNSHQQTCYYQVVSCPVGGCGWKSVAVNLATHIQQAHRDRILATNPFMQRFNMQTLINKKKITFFLYILKGLYIVVIDYVGGTVTASISRVATLLDYFHKESIYAGIACSLKPGRMDVQWSGEIFPYFNQTDKSSNSLIFKVNSNCEWLIFKIGIYIKK